MKNEFLGDRLRVVRHFNGLSMQELGELVSTSRQYIQKLETGATTPTDDLSEALAEALNVSHGYFSMRRNSYVSSDQCHFRSLKSAPETAKNQAIASGDIFDKFVTLLDEFLELPKVNFPEHSIGNNINDIENIAEHCRQVWGIEISSPISNMTRVIENAGGVVTHFNNLSPKVDAFSVHRKRPIFIRNIAKDSVCRQRFDLAHECGHIVLHTGIPTGDNDTEMQANRFASAFLLPRGAFLTDFSNALVNRDFSWKHIYEMKLRWKVSVAAIIRRAHDLNLIDSMQYRYANIYLRKSGQSKKEKFDSDIPPENPELIAIAINHIKSHEPELQNRIISGMAVTPKLFEMLLPEGIPKIVRHDYDGDNIIILNNH